MESGLWNGLGLCLQLVQIHAFFKDKTRAKTRKIAQEAEKEKRGLGARETHGCASQVAHPCHHHHGQTVVAVVPGASPASRMLGPYLTLF